MQALPSKRRREESHTRQWFLGDLDKVLRENLLGTFFRRFRFLERQFVVRATQRVKEQVKDFLEKKEREL